MKIDKNKIREYIACYGSDIEEWPKDLQVFGIAALHDANLRDIFQEEIRFENMLLKCEVESMPLTLADRIIASARARVQYSDNIWQLSGFLKQVRMSAIAAMLLLGFAIGFGTFAHIPESSEASIQSFPDDEGVNL